jgi:hypothetical protein
MYMYSVIFSWTIGLIYYIVIYLSYIVIWYYFSINSVCVSDKERAYALLYLYYNNQAFVLLYVGNISFVG